MGQDGGGPCPGAGRRGARDRGGGDTGWGQGRGVTFFGVGDCLLRSRLLLWGCLPRTESLRLTPSPPKRDSGVEVGGCHRQGRWWVTLDGPASLPGGGEGQPLYGRDPDAWPRVPPTSFPAGPDTPGQGLAVGLRWALPGHDPASAHSASWWQLAVQWASLAGCWEAPARGGLSPGRVQGPHLPMWEREPPFVVIPRRPECEHHLTHGQVAVTPVSSACSPSTTGSGPSSTSPPGPGQRCRPWSRPDLLRRVLQLALGAEVWGHGSRARGHVTARDQCPASSMSTCAPWLRSHDAPAHSEGFLVASSHPCACPGGSVPPCSACQLYVLYHMVQEGTGKDSAQASVKGLGSA